MLNYIKADFYRIFRKKSFYIYFGVILVLYLIIMAITLGGKNAYGDSAVSSAPIFFQMLPMFFGGFIFAMVYNDDLTARSLPSAIGFGVNKTVILFSKTIVGILFTSAMFLLTGAVYCVSFMVFGANLSGQNAADVFKLLINPAMLTFAYMALAGIISFGTQRATISLSVYLVLGTGIVGQLLNMLLNIKEVMNIFGDLSKYTIENITKKLTDGMIGAWGFAPDIGAVRAQFSPEYLIQYIIFFAAAVIIASLAFNKKELEF